MSYSVIISLSTETTILLAICEFEIENKKKYVENIINIFLKYSFYLPKEGDFIVPNGKNFIINIRLLVGSMSLSV